MAGHVRERKRWRRQDGPDGTLRRLRRQLAEDGCADSQIILAKHLLQEAKGVDGKEKERDAVTWLLKAAEQNSDQAAELLTECFYLNKGLTQENYDRVHKHLTMNHNDRTDRTTTRDLYNKLSPEEVTTSKIITDRNEVGMKTSKENDKSVDAAKVKMSCAGVIFTEDDLLDMAGKMATGESLDAPNEKEEQSLKFENQSWREQIEAPVRRYVAAYVHSLEYISRNGPKIILSLIIPKIYHIFIFLLIQYADIPTLSLFVFFVLLFYASFTSMVVSTFQMLHLQKCARSLQYWAYTSKLAVEMESLFQWNHGNTPFIQYFASIVLLLFTYPLIPPKYIASSELMVFSAIMAVSTFVAIGKTNEWLVTISVFMHLLLLTFPSIYLSLPFSTYIGDWMFCAGYINLSRYIRLHVGFPGLFFLFIPATFVTMAVKNKNSSHGLHRVVLPHFVCVFWWQLAATFFCSSSLISVIRGLFLVGGFFLFLPYLILMLATSVVVGLIYSFFFRSSICFCAILVAIPSIFQNCLSNNQHFKNYKTLLKFTYCSVIFVYIVSKLYISDTQFSNQTEALLEWQYYHKFCHQPAWEAGCVAQVQYECRQLKGTKISWQGSVTRVNIVNTWNEIEQLLSLFPSTWTSSIRCFFGAPYLDYCTQCDMKALLHSLKQNECHLLAWDVYKFELVVAVQTDVDWADIFVDVGDYFTPFMLRLQRGDEIIFNGSLIEGLGSSRPTINLDGIECVSCKNAMEPVTKTNTQFIDISMSFRSVIHFVFSPLIECIF